MLGDGCDIGSGGGRRCILGTDGRRARAIPHSPLPMRPNLDGVRTVLASAGGVAAPGAASAAPAILGTAAMAPSGERNGFYDKIPYVGQIASAVTNAGFGIDVGMGVSLTNQFKVNLILYTGLENSNDKLMHFALTSSFHSLNDPELTSVSK